VNGLGCSCSMALWEDHEAQCSTSQPYPKKRRYGMHDHGVGPSFYQLPRAFGCGGESRSSGLCPRVGARIDRFIVLPANLGRLLQRLRRVPDVPSSVAP